MKKALLSYGVFIFLYLACIGVGLYLALVRDDSAGVFLVIGALGCLAIKGTG